MDMSFAVKVKRRLKGFSLDMELESEGGSLGVLGSSGCGKSMTLRCIAGIEIPDQGRIAVNGRVLYDSGQRINLSPQQRKIGYLFQNYALFPHMTVAKNIGCGIMAVKKDRGERTRKLLERFQLEELGERYPSQLSGGQQQRVALARLLACEPEVILLDEPFSALDAHLKEKMQIQLMNLLREYKKDVIMVTHNRDEAYRICDQLMVMDQGRCLEYGNTKELFEKPKLLQTARLTGCKNLSRVRSAGDTRVEALDWGITLETGRIVSGQVTHIGIRAHDFHPMDAGQYDKMNRIKIMLQEETEDPFEWNFIFKAKPRTSADIWWKISKQVFQGLPEYLYVEPEDILLLREG